MEAKHTPGPWRISSRASTHIETENGRGICSTGGYQQNFDVERVLAENEGNARLIAAAPDLLAACKAAASILAAEVEARCGFDETYDTAAAGPVLAIVNAALAKAESRHD